MKLFFIHCFLKVQCNKKRVFKKSFILLDEDCSRNFIKRAGIEKDVGRERNFRLHADFGFLFLCINFEFHFRNDAIQKKKGFVITIPRLKKAFFVRTRKSELTNDAPLVH